MSTPPDKPDNGNAIEHPEKEPLAQQQPLEFAQSQEHVVPAPVPASPANEEVSTPREASTAQGAPTPEQVTTQAGATSPVLNADGLPISPITPTTDQAPRPDEPPPTPELHLTQLRTDVGLSEGAAAYYAEAAAVVLESCEHVCGVRLDVAGSIEREYHIHWEQVTDDVRACHADSQDATEHGAYGIAILVIYDATPYVAVEQSYKSTGFDWWLGEQQDEYPMQRKARLEVSGIRTGTLPQIRYRLQKKLKQTQQSDAMMLPALAVIVEYSRPRMQVGQR